MMPKRCFELHDGLMGGNYEGETSTHKILRARYYWSKFFMDSHTYAQKSKVHQTIVRKENRLAIPLQPLTIEQPFQQWVLDIIGEINPN